MIRVTINGHDRELPEATSLAAYVSSLGANSRMVAIALNGEVVRRDDWPDVTLSDGDTLEIVRAVGGG